LRKGQRRERERERFEKAKKACQKKAQKEAEKQAANATKAIQSIQKRKWKASSNPPVQRPQKMAKKEVEKEVDSENCVLGPLPKITHHGHNVKVPSRFK
jgi:methyl coenzyme M reductase subunit C-like uncharacterized protein (methanogenesis marker protein 7)